MTVLLLSDGQYSVAVVALGTFSKSLLDAEI
jgi:hypothetical protein